MKAKWHTETETTKSAAHGDEDFLKIGSLASGVREIIQGPVDHAQKDGQDTLTMKFIIEENTNEELNEIFDAGGTESYVTQMTLPQSKEHTKALKDVLEAEESFHPVDSMRTLHVEDDLRIGVQGQHDQWDPSEAENGFFDEESQSNIFLFLFRVIATSMQKKGTGGSWGLGKYATYIMSKLRTAFYVSTYLDQEGKYRRFALGQAHWKSRRMRPPLGYPEELIGKDGKVSYGPVIWYGKEETSVEKNPKTWMPITDNEDIDKLCDILGIRRTIDMPGTSIMIPLPHDEITGNNIAQAVLANYSVAIARGMLVVIIEDGEYSVILDAEFMRGLTE